VLQTTPCFLLQGSTGKIGIVEESLEKEPGRRE
jgi:hypothetical protein